MGRRQAHGTSATRGRLAVAVHSNASGQCDGVHAIVRLDHDNPSETQGPALRQLLELRGDGALAAGLPDEVGALVPGAKADITVVSLDCLRPVASHLGAVVAYASGADVDTVIVDGILRKSGGELVGVDRVALVRAAEASRDRLLSQIGTSAEELRFAGQLAPSASDG